MNQSREANITPSCELSPSTRDGQRELSRRSNSCPHQSRWQRVVGVAHARCPVTEHGKAGAVRYRSGLDEAVLDRPARRVAVPCEFVWRRRAGAEVPEARDAEVGGRALRIQLVVLVSVALMRLEFDHPSDHSLGRWTLLDPGTAGGIGRG